MNRQIPAKYQIKITKLSEQDADSVAVGNTPEERWAMMWQLALNAWAFKGEEIAKPGLYRHIISVFRRKG